MPEYKPALTEQEHEIVEELMKELQKIQSREEQLKKELRMLIYKADRR